MCVYLCWTIKIVLHDARYNEYKDSAGNVFSPLHVAADFLELRVRITPGAWMSVCCKCCVLSGRGLCDELITRPEKSYCFYVS